MVIHCTAGKDRTGFMVAVLLKCLSISNADIYSDYLPSNQYCDQLHLSRQVRALLEHLLGFVPNAEAVEALSCVSLDYLDAAFDEVERQFGSVERYLEGLSFGCEPQARLQERLLSP